VIASVILILVVAEVIYQC